MWRGTRGAQRAGDVNRQLFVHPDDDSGIQSVEPSLFDGGFVGRQRKV